MMFLIFSNNIKYLIFSKIKTVINTNWLSIVKEKCTFFLIGHVDKNTIDLSKFLQYLNILIFLSKKNYI